MAIKDAQILRILGIQQDQLAKWKLRLNESYYNALAAEVAKRNSELREFSDPYSVFRGDDMTDFISNTHPKDLEPLMYKIVDDNDKVIDSLENLTLTEAEEKLPELLNEDVDAYIQGM